MLIGEDSIVKVQTFIVIGQDFERGIIDTLVSCTSCRDQASLTFGSVAESDIGTRIALIL